MIEKQEKFIQVLNNNKGILYKVISIYCTDFDDRKDLEQEIIIHLWNSFQNYDSKYKMSTWIYRIALNVSVSFYRRDKNRKTKTTFINNSIFEIVDFDEKSDVLDERLIFLNKFISELDIYNKEIMILFLENLSYNEIAEIVGISESNVGTKMNRIKKKLEVSFNQIKYI